MQDQVNATPAPKRVPWNKGKLTGAKPPCCKPRQASQCLSWVKRYRSHSAAL